MSEALTALRSSLFRAPPAVSIVSRYGAAILGGYVFAYGFTGLATLAGFAAGLGFAEARTLAWMLGFLVYLGALLWAFTPRRSAWVWVVLAGGGVVMGAAAWWLSEALL